MNAPTFTTPMQLIPIKETPEENEALMRHVGLQAVVQMTIDFYKKVGYAEPWIDYLAEESGDWVGSAAFKGAPVNGTIEIAYGTNENYRNKGVGATICKLLVDLALTTDPLLKITARTISDDNFSSKILLKNNFICTGTVQDPEDGEV
jgi:ribosomal-protein-alanine N-acetyltransferase